MALIDIPNRVEEYMIAHDGWTPPCFAVALDAVTGGNGVAYEEFDKHFPPAGGVNLFKQEKLLEACFPENVWLYSPNLVRLMAPFKITEANDRVAKKATQRMLAEAARAMLIISEPGSESETNHARAITQARSGTAVIWNSQNNPLIQVVRKTELKQTLANCLDRPDSHLFAIGFQVLLQDLFL